MVEQLLVFAVETQEVRHRQGLHGQTGDGVHHTVLIEVQAEVVPRLCPPSDDVPALESTHPDSLIILLHRDGRSSALPSLWDK